MTYSIIVLKKVAQEKIKEFKKEKITKQLKIWMEENKDF